MLLVSLNCRIIAMRKCVKQVAYAGKLENDRILWTKIVVDSETPKKDMEVKRKTGEEKHLGAVLGPVRDTEHFIKNRVDEWVNEIHRLVEIEATIELPTAFSSLE